MSASTRSPELTKSREKLPRLLDTRAELAQIEERLAALPGLEETLERFREAGLEDRLKEQSLLVREERLLASIPERNTAITVPVSGPLRAATESRRLINRINQNGFRSVPG